MQSKINSSKYPKVGIGIMVKKENKVLLGLRKSSHASNCWCFPGGKQHFGETMEECAIRELKEETGLSIEKLKLISVADEMRYIKSDNKHFLNIGFLTNFCGGTPKVMEPDKCIEWRWFDLDNLPKNLLEGTELILNNYYKQNIY